MNTVEQVAQEILDGRLGILEGSRKMVLLYHEQNLDDDLYNVFRGLDSETDHLLLEPILFPVSDNRREDNARQIGEYETAYRTDILEACRLICLTYRSSE